MSRGLSMLLGGALLSGIVLTLTELWRRHHEREHAADYVQRIQVLKADKPLDLPAVRAIHAQVVKPTRQRRAKVSPPSRFQQRQGK